MTALSSGEAAIAGWIDGQGEAALALLADIVNIDSGSGHQAGTAAVAERIAAFLSGVGVAVERRQDARGGPILHAAVPGRGNAPGGVLLLGHMDTVFPLGEAARRPFTIRDGRAYGPGVADMKAGLVINCLALGALNAGRWLHAPLAGLFTNDEEIASPAGRTVIEGAAAGARIVLNAEPGRASGNVVGQRKGGVFMRCTVTGKAAHAGVEPGRGISAIHELAHKIVAWQALNDHAAGVTVNVGVVEGGQSINTTAPSAEALIDLRYPQAEQRDRLMAAVEAIVARSTVPGAQARLAIMGEFLPLVPSAASTALFGTYQAVAADLGFGVAAEQTGGCADIGFAAALGAATLCGLGAVGGAAHSPDEYIELATLLPRAKALALTILRLDRAQDQSPMHGPDDAKNTGRHEGQEGRPRS